MMLHYTFTVPEVPHQMQCRPAWDDVHVSSTQLMIPHVLNSSRPSGVNV